MPPHTRQRSAHVSHRRGPHPLHQASVSPALPSTRLHCPLMNCGRGTRGRSAAHTNNAGLLGSHSSQQLSVLGVRSFTFAYLFFFLVQCKLRRAGAWSPPHPLGLEQGWAQSTRPVHVFRVRDVWALSEVSLLSDTLACLTLSAAH